MRWFTFLKDGLRFFVKADQFNESEIQTNHLNSNSAITEVEVIDRRRAERRSNKKFAGGDNFYLFKDFGLTFIVQGDSVKVTQQFLEQKYGKKNIKLHKIEDAETQRIVQQYIESGWDVIKDKRKEQRRNNA
jgi:hypothetical protein